MAKFFAEYTEVRHMGRTWTRRSDTRLYFGDQEMSLRPSQGRCYGVVYLANPGSAEPMRKPILKDGLQNHPWGPLCFRKSPPLEQLERVMEKVLEELRSERFGLAPAKRLVEEGYLQVLNLSYFREPNDIGKKALRAWPAYLASTGEVDDTVRRAHRRHVKFVLFGWGMDSYRVTFDKQRVANALRASMVSDCHFLCPKKEEVVEEGKKVRRKLVGPEAIEPAIPRAAPYPVQRNKKAGFNEKYPAKVGAAIALCLRQI